MQEKATHAEGQNGEAPLEVENNGNHAKQRRKAASPSEYPDSLSYIRQRHGRTDLRPMPSDDPEDPLNWANWRKNLLLVQVAWHACMGPFSAAATIPAFVTYVEDFGISITQASYTVSIVIIFIGTFPLLWSPISARIGRRPVFLISTLVSSAMHLAGAYTHSYGALMTTRVFQAIFICPPQAIGVSTVKEVFFEHERGRKLGIWALLVTLGPPLSPFVMGFVVYNVSAQWIFYLLAIINLVEFFLYLFFGPETLYDRPERGKGGTSREIDMRSSKWYAPYITFRRWSKEPWSHLPLEVIRPLSMALRPEVMMPAFAYAIVFTYTNVLLTVEIPSLLGLKYNLNAQQTGLQFIAAILGAILGEPIAGYGSDKLMAWQSKRHNGVRIPEKRLPLALPGCILSIIGLIVFGVQLNNTAAGRWSVTPLIGVAIALFGLQLVTTVCYTYAVDTQPLRTGDTALFVAFWRQLYAFTGPFYLNIMYEEMGPVNASGLLCGLIGVAFLMIIFTYIMGARWRERQAQIDATSDSKSNIRQRPPKA